MVEIAAKGETTCSICVWLTSALHSCRRSVCSGLVASGIQPPVPMTWGSCAHDGGVGGSGGERHVCAV